jgi:very-short-patch-repair endonuclease
MTERRAAIALDDALRRGQTTLGALDHCLYLTARRGRNGCGVLRRLVHERIGLVEPPNSGLETVIFEMIKASTLALPSLQVVIRDAEGRFVAGPDFVYPSERLIVQGHSKQWHWGAAAESKDLEQHNALCALGYRVLYLTWSDATRHADRTVMTIGRMLNGTAADLTPQNRPLGGRQLQQKG